MNNAGTNTRHPVEPRTGMSTDRSTGTKRVFKVTHNPSSDEDRKMGADHPGLLINSDIENSQDLQFKYAVALDVMVEALQNVRLLRYMEEWYGTRYRYGGNSRSGVDCSAFAAGLLANVYELAVPRTVREQHDKSQQIAPYELLEGDLVFFNTKGPLTHVGVYLMNNKFIHASVSGGVMISDLNESYYVKRFTGAGRVRSY